MHWKLQYDTKTSFEMLLSLDVRRGAAREGHRIALESVKASSVAAPVKSLPDVTSRTESVELRRCTLVLTPAPHGQTRMTAAAEVSVRAKSFEGAHRSSMWNRRGSAAITRAGSSGVSPSDAFGRQPRQTHRSSSMWKRTGNAAVPRAGSSGVSPSDAFSLLGKLLYCRFEKEEEMDRRRLKHFQDNIDNAPPLTLVESAIVKTMLQTRKEVDLNAKRMAGSINDSVEKFLWWRDGEHSGWGKSKCRIDTSAEELFTNLWVLPTYKNENDHRDHNGNLPRVVWENVDGNRSLQHSVVIKFPTGLKNRCFETTITWEARKLDNGLKEYIIALIPTESYAAMGGGPTLHHLSGTENFVMGQSRGVFTIQQSLQIVASFTGFSE